MEEGVKMVYHIVSNGKYLIDVLSVPHLGAPGMLGCRPIVHSYEFEWGYSFKDRMEFEDCPMFEDVKKTLEERNINYEVVTEVC